MAAFQDTFWGLGYASKSVYKLLMQLVAVIGLGQFGTAIALHLAQHGAEVIAIDRQMEPVDAIKDQVARALCMDATEERALRAAGVGEASTVVLALGENELEQAVLTTMLVRDLGAGRIISRAASPVQGKVLERLGVSRVLFPEKQIGQQVARQILSPTVVDLVPLSPGTSVAEIKVPTVLVGRSIGEAGIRKTYGLNIVAIRHYQRRVKDDGATFDHWDVDNLPGPDTPMRAGDILVVVGADEKLAALAEA